MPYWPTGSVVTLVSSLFGRRAPALVTRSGPRRQSGASARSWLGVGGLLLAMFVGLGSPRTASALDDYDYYAFYWAYHGHYYCYFTVLAESNDEFSRQAYLTSYYAYVNAANGLLTPDLYDDDDFARAKLASDLALGYIGQTYQLTGGLYSYTAYQCLVYSAYYNELADDRRFYRSVNVIIPR